MPQDDEPKSYYPDDTPAEETPPSETPPEDAPPAGEGEGAPSEPKADDGKELEASAEDEAAKQAAETARIYASLGEQFVSDPAAAVSNLLAAIGPEADAIREAILKQVGGTSAPTKPEAEKPKIDLKDYEPVTKLEEALVGEMDAIRSIPEVRKQVETGFARVEAGVTQAHDQIGVLAAVAQASQIIVSGVLDALGVKLPELDFTATLKEAGEKGVAPADYIAESWGPKIQAAFAETRTPPKQQSKAPDTPRSKSNTPSPPEPKSLEDIWAWAGDQVATKAS